MRRSFNRILVNVALDGALAAVAAPLARWIADPGGGLLHPLWFLASGGIFHAGLSPMEKRVALTRFRSGEPVVMVATIAFGMGIDRPDVRFVVHLGHAGQPGGVLPADRPGRPRR